MWATVGSRFADAPRSSGLRAYSGQDRSTRACAARCPTRGGRRRADLVAQVRHRALSRVAIRACRTISCIRRSSGSRIASTGRRTSSRTLSNPHDMISNTAPPALEWCRGLFVKPRAAAISLTDVASSAFTEKLRRGQIEVGAARIQRDGGAVSGHRSKYYTALHRPVGRSPRLREPNRLRKFVFAGSAGRREAETGRKRCPVRHDCCTSARFSFDVFVSA